MEQKKENTRKEAGTIRGMVRRYSDHSFEFTPFGKGEPVYQDQHKYGNGVTVATTRGASPKKVVRIEVPADAPDVPFACMDKLTTAFGGEEPSLIVGMRGRQLMKDDTGMIVLNQKKGLLMMEMSIDLTQTPNYQSQLFNLFNRMNQCLAINETLLKSAVRAHVANLKK